MMSVAQITERTIHTNLTFVFQIALIGYYNYGERILVLDSKNLLVEGTYFLKGVSGGDGINEEKAFASTHVLFPHSPGKQRNQLFGPIKNILKGVNT